MEPFVTDATAPSEWLIDAADPLLTADRLARIGDARRPDRLAWNTFRTLALWNTDAWIPALLETTCGEGGRLAALEWAGAQVVPWGAGLDAGAVCDVVCDVVLDGPEAYVVVACALVANPPGGGTAIRAAAMAALDGSVHDAREAGLVVVSPQGWTGEQLRHAAAVELRDGRLASDLLEGAMGTVTWADLGRLAADLAEEGAPDTIPEAQVRELIRQMGPLAGASGA